MRKKYRLIMIILISIFFLCACSDFNDVKTQQDTRFGQTIAINGGKEITLQTEESMDDGEEFGSSYKFDGFIGEDTLVFSYYNSSGREQLFLPAKVGYTTKLKNFVNYVPIKIVSFDREGGTVTIKRTDKK